jgi:hypothetical protein
LRWNGLLSVSIVGLFNGGQDSESILQDDTEEGQKR